MSLAHQFVEEVPNRNYGINWMFCVGGHSWEFNRHKNWELLEELGELVGGKEDIWYATNREIFEYAEAFNSLIFSSRGDRVYNPTCRELFFFKDRLYSVKPGETVEVKI